LSLVFAPTEDAFNKLDAKTRDKIMSGNGCAQDILKNHLLPNVVCSGIIESKAKTNNMLGKYIVMNRNEDGEVMVEGKKIIIRDIMGTNGVIHVIEDVIVPESARNVPEALKEKKLDAFVELFEAADLIDEMEAMANMTIFAPSKKALAELPADYVTNLKNDKSALKEFLMYHVTGPKLCKCDLKNNLELQSGVDGKKIRVNNYGSNLLFGDRSKVQTAQCSRLVDMDNEVCGGFIHVVDKVLLPPAGNIFTILKDANSYSKFLDLVAFAEMESELTGDVAHTVLVPTNEAFDKLEDDVITRMFEEKEIAEKVIKNHIVKEMICCWGIQRNVFIFNQSRKRLASGEIVNMRRSDTGHIFVNKASINTCDMVADNGVAHSVDEVLLPRELKPVVEQQQSQRRRTVIKNILDPFNLF
jgi:transforming growth factor-beta-induced protein